MHSKYPLPVCGLSFNFFYDVSMVQKFKMYHSFSLMICVFVASSYENTLLYKIESGLF